MRRLPKKIYIKIPSQEDRLKILKQNIPQHMSLSEVDMQNLAAASSGFSGSDLVNFANDLLMQPLRMLISATCFLVSRSEDSEEVTAVTPCTLPCPGAVLNTRFEEMAEMHGEKCMVLPPLTSSVAFETLQSYRKNVKPPDTQAYENFLLK